MFHNELVISHQKRKTAVFDRCWLQHWCEQLRSRILTSTCYTGRRRPGRRQPETLAGTEGSSWSATSSVVSKGVLRGLWLQVMPDISAHNIASIKIILYLRKQDNFCREFGFLHTGVISFRNNTKVDVFCNDCLYQCIFIS